FAGAPPVWPGSVTAEVGLPSAAIRAHGYGAPAKVPGLPVTVDPVGASASEVARARVDSYDRAVAAAAGVDGLLLRVSRWDGGKAAGPARVSVAYDQFRYAYGGDWASRLRLRALPACALTTPAAPECQGRDLKSINDTTMATVTALVDVAPLEVRDASDQGLEELRLPASVGTFGGTLLALSSGPSGGAGDYQATSLSPSATWSSGGNTGDFTWSYPLRVPPSLGGPEPTISLAYSSAGVDGRMASTNNQPSWIGEGFEWHPRSIERKYSSCEDDMGSGANNSVATGDQCWETENASLSLPGHAGELIKDATEPNRWHLRTDDGTRIERKTGASNGDNDGEWWLVTTTDGTQYWFGGKAGTNSTLTVPVFGNHSGEPCHAPQFANSSCTQAYRWQLDHVVDAHGNTMTFTYAKETNRYGRNNNPSDAVVYDRAGYLTRIDYGTRS